MFSISSIHGYLALWMTVRKVEAMGDAIVWCRKIARVIKWYMLYAVQFKPGENGCNPDGIPIAPFSQKSLVLTLFNISNSNNPYQACCVLVVGLQRSFMTIYRYVYFIMFSDGTTGRISLILGRALFAYSCSTTSTTLTTATIDVARLLSVIQQPSSSPYWCLSRHSLVHGSRDAV